MPAEDSVQEVTVIMKPAYTTNREVLLCDLLYVRSQGDADDDGQTHAVEREIIVLPR